MVMVKGLICVVKSFVYGFVESDSVYVINVKVWWMFKNEQWCCEICLWFWRFGLNLVVDDLLNGVLVIIVIVRGGRESMAFQSCKLITILIV